MDRQGGKEGSEEVSAREEEEAKESKESEDVEDVEGGIENEASSEENSDEDEEEEGGDGPINAIISLLQLAAPILEDLSDVRTKREEISKFLTSRHLAYLVVDHFSLNPKPTLPKCSK